MFTAVFEISVAYIQFNHDLIWSWTAPSYGEVFLIRTDSGFLNRGGAKDYVHASHNPSSNPDVHYGRDPGPLSGPWKLWGFKCSFMLSLSLILSILTLIQNWMIRKGIPVDLIYRGVRACCPSAWIERTILYTTTLIYYFTCHPLCHIITPSPLLRNKALNY